MIEEITIKFGTELKSTQYSWKSQLYNLHATNFINLLTIVSFKKFFKKKKCKRITCVNVFYSNFIIRWRDNKQVTLTSKIEVVHTLSTTSNYCKESLKRKKDHDEEYYDEQWEKKNLRSNFLQELRERESYCFLCFVFCS